MYNLIAPSFFQKKNCKLPGIGYLALLTHPAETDFLHTQIKSPYQEIIFSQEQSDDKIFNEFSAISEIMKRKLDAESLLELDGIGTFTKDENGSIQFKALPLPAIFYPPVAAQRVIHQDTEHSILVGDRETTNVVMTEYYSEDETTVKDLWWVWAIVLGVIGIGVLSFYLYTNGLDNFGNVIVL
jgi:hypothetical protein